MHPLFRLRFLVDPLSLSQQILGNYLKSRSNNATAASFHVTFNSLVINGPTAHFVFENFAK